MNEELNTLMSDFLGDHTPKHGLPASVYTDPEFWRIECETIFTQHWIFVGFAHSLAKPGDVIPITVANQPLILVKNKTGDIAAFHNACRHRCLKLVESPKNVGGLICCPYHAWSYHLDGRLNNAPFFGGKDKHYPPGFNADDYGLKPVRTVVWHDWIFINLDGKAPPFENHVSALSKRLDGIDFAQIKPVATLDFGEIATNWKFIMENFIEPYHVQFVHRTTTSQPLKDHYTIIDGACLGSAVDLDENNKKAGGGLSVSSRYLALFPNFIVGRYFPDQLGVYLNIPVDAGHMMQKRAIYTTDGRTMTEDEAAAQKKLWWDVHKEDHEICERLQLGRASPVANDGGVLSPHWEDSVHAFQKLVVGAVMQSPNNNPKYRLAHTMIRVLDLEKSIHFYCTILGMQVLRRTDYPDGRFTNTFIGYGAEGEFPTLELTHNWDQTEHYDKGDGWGHICIETPDVYEACEKLAAQDVKIIKPASPMKHGNRILAFVEDPDGYRIELNEKININQQGKNNER